MRLNSTRNKSLNSKIKKLCTRLFLITLMILPILLNAGPEKKLNRTNEMRMMERGVEKKIERGVFPTKKKYVCSSFLMKIHASFSEIINSGIFYKKNNLEVLPPFSCSGGLLANPDFETDFSGWDFFSNANISNDSYFGNNAAEITGGSGSVGKNITAYEREIYSLEVYAKKTGAENASVGIKFLDIGFNEIKTVNKNITSASYQPYRLSAVAPEGTAYVQVSGWKDEGSGSAFFDGFCFEKWEVPGVVCSEKFCELSPSWGNYVWAMDDSGTGANWKDYDLGGLILCANTDGTLSLMGNIINGHDSDWHASVAVSCGQQDGWYLELTLTNRQQWAAFQGSFVQNAGCGANHTDWDYWEISGSLTGTGCNAGRTISISGSQPGYLVQAGWGGNSQTCLFGISTWMTGLENGQPIQADLYAHLDANCYYDLFPEDCANGLDDDGDGLADCYDSDCAPQILENESFEDVSGITFGDTFEGNPAYALPNNATIMPGWRMSYGCGGNCFDSYWVDDSADLVNNPNGDYFLWMPGASYCAGQSISVDLNKCYEITFTAAAWSVPGPQSAATIVFEVLGGGIDNGDGGAVVLFEKELPASPDWQHLNWRTFTFTWSPPASATTNFYISQSNASTTAKGVAIDRVLIKEICCDNGSIVPEISCEDGRDIELQFVGINNAIPAVLPVADLTTIDSIIVEVVYKSGNPGSTITVEDAGGTSYSASRQSVGSNAYVYRTTLPPTASISYSNTSNADKAQSLSAFIFRNNQPGKTVVTQLTTIGGYNGTFTLDFNIPKSVAARNVKLTLPVSEITYDNRSLDFVATAGSVSVSKSRTWGPGNHGFPNGCCMDTIEFFLPNVAPDVDLVSVDVISPGGGSGQSFVIAATIAVEMFCDEICGNGIDDDGDGLTDNEDPDCLCPDIFSDDTTHFQICEGETVTFNVSTNAPNPPYHYIEFYRFDTQQPNPYTTADPKVWLDAFYNYNGTGSVSISNFPTDGTAEKTYYVYGCVKPAPPNPDSCFPLIEYVVTVKPGTVLTLGPGTTICNNTSTTLTATATGGPAPYTFTWDNGLGNGAVKEVSPVVETTYHATVTNANGCTDEASVTVSVMEAPVADAGPNVEVCPGGSTTLSASGSGGTTPYSYQWDHSLGSGQTQVVTPSVTTTYTLTLISDNGCIDTDQVTVTVGSCVEDCTNGLDDDNDGLVDCDDDDCVPVPDAGDDVTLCAGTSTTLTAGVPGSTETFQYDWSHGLGSGAVQTVTPLTTTTFTVTVTNAAGCAGTAQVTVTVNNCPEVCADGIDNDGDGLIDCEDPDCYAVGAPSLDDDDFTTCPSLAFTDRVNLNDANLQDPVYSIAVHPSNGLVSMDATGKFTYTPFGAGCGADMFVYQVCNQLSGCCATAVATIHIGDEVPPLLMDVPADVTISCDETVPDPPLVLAFDECPGIYVDFDETTDEYAIGGCSGYTITRTWTATDLCGNTASASQVISVEDLEGPELFRVYTLPNGTRLMAGISQRTTLNWKYIPFPTHFTQTPLVFSQVISTNENSAVVVRHRNVTNEGFEMALQEQEASDATHLPEQVAWLALEADTMTGLWETGLAPNVGSTSHALNLGQSFPDIPRFLFSAQTVNETDPFSMRVMNASNNGADVFLNEEQSKDTEQSHPGESVAYLALTPLTDILDAGGGFVAESGHLSLTHAWATVHLNHHFNKPVVIMGAIGNADPDPVTVRVRNVTANSFEVRLQEWDHQDGAHLAEEVPYLVVEGGLPDDTDVYCSTDGFILEPGVNVFVRDNCDNQLALHFDEISTLLPDGLQVVRQWSAADDCGNTLTFERTDNCTVAALRLNALLYGAIMDNFADTLMSDKLRAGGFLPLTEPYSDLSYFDHRGKGGGETAPAALLDVTGENAVVDWLYLEIRDSADASNVLATRSVLLKRNGEVTDENGNRVVYFPNLREGGYQVAFRHRNHLGLMTGHSWRLSSLNIPFIDFTDINVSVFEKDAAAVLTGGRRAAWAGDFNGDRKVIYQGPQNDVFYLFSKVLADPGNTAFLANYISHGYDRTDIDMDGRIIYQGPDNERAKLLYHTIMSHPVNTGFLANYIVEEMLP